MNNSPSDLRRLAYFAEIVRSGSIRAAGRKLGVTAPVLSQALAELEANLGTSLLQRTTRRQSLTDSGKAVFEEASAMTAAAARAMAIGTESQSPRGRLSITLPVELASLWLPRLIPDFAARCPDVTLSVSADDRPIDLNASPFEVALRTAFRRPEQTVAGRELPLALVTAPSLIARSTGGLAGQLSKLNLIVGFHPDERVTAPEVLAWKHPRGRLRRLPMAAAIRVNSRLLARDLALAGLGAALLLAPAVEPEIAAGRLVALGEGYSFGRVDVTPLLRDKHPSPAARAFVGFLETWPP